jgi:hypothetical protein
LAFLAGDSWDLNFAICWDSLVLIGTFNSKNLISYAQSAGHTFLSFSLAFFYLFHYPFFLLVGAIFLSGLGLIGLV